MPHNAADIAADVARQQILDEGAFTKRRQAEIRRVASIAVKVVLALMDKQHEPEATEAAPVPQIVPEVAQPANDDAFETIMPRRDWVVRRPGAA